MKLIYVYKMILLLFRYQLNDPEFQRLKEITEEQRKLGGLVFASEYVPILRPFVQNMINSMRSNVREYLDSIIKQKFLSHQKDYQEGQIRDFTDALIFAKQDSLKNENESAPYLTDGNLTLTLSDLFSGKKFCFANYF